MSVALAMMMMMMACALGCGSDDTQSKDPPKDEEDAGDGKVRPPANGTHISEGAACDALLGGQEARISALSCLITTPICPSLLRSEFGKDCMEYDQGSVDGCIAHYKAQANCDALEEAIDKCVVTPYPGTEPAGCP